MKVSILRFIAKSRLYYIVLLGILFLVLNLVTRLSLQYLFPDVLPLSGYMLPALAKGFVNDLATLCYVLLLPATLLLLPTDGFLKKRAGKIYTVAVFFSCSFIFIFTAVAEYFFWDEFSARFNFIAVDYLIYTTEVVKNIIESYPLFALLTVVFLLAVAVTACLWRISRNIQAGLDGVAGGEGRGKTLGSRVGVLSGMHLAAFLLFVWYSPLVLPENRFWNEYAKNGVYELFSAYRNNQLDYRAFYKTMDPSAAFALVQRELRAADNSLEPSQGHSLARVVNAAPTEVRPNVIIVIMESMGSKWFGEYTPNLTQLAARGLSFSNMLSTGTRTIRGLEAVMLSVPPTPGNSIVRRPDNNDLFTLGSVFHERGYGRAFIYGGIGFFDNMNGFFADNGYQVTDKLGFAPENKTFANAWGQCDEDLYAQSLMQADKSHAAGRLFQQVLLTTSNHRPFTYPEGKVALPPGDSRRGAVQYTDYAIGEFMRQAETKPWFANTVFVFVGDHPSAVAGKTEVPADAYGIICILYGPKFFTPAIVATLCSQIDVAPTLLASLGWGYISPFFGTDARVLDANEGRAWIATYQLLGFRTNSRLVVLKPDSGAELTRVAQIGQKESGTENSPADEDLIARSVAFYQCAYDLFTSKKMKETAVRNFAQQPVLPQQ